MKKVAQLLLVIFALGALGLYAWNRFAEAAPAEFVGANSQEPSAVIVPSSQEPSAAEPTAAMAGSTVTVTYFTTNVRCVSCRKIEELTRVAVEERFATEIAAGKVRYQMINLDEPQNQHFAADYAISFKTVVVSEEGSQGVLRWKKLDEVWSLINQPAAFKALVIAPVDLYLSKQS